jgi:glycosyltransferase involved in cell wall biosynthesis
VARAIVLEPFATGHRPTYVSWITDTLLRSNLDVHIAAPRSVLDHPAVVSLADATRGGSRARLIEVAAPPASSGRGGALSLWRFERQMHTWLAHAHRSASGVDGADLLVVPYLDYCYHYIAIHGSPFRGTRWCGITMRTEFPRQGLRLSARAALRLRLLRRLLGQPALHALFSIDPFAREFIAERSTDRRWSALRYLPDPADMMAVQPRSLARESLGLPSEQRVVLLFGSIDLRKGLPELLQGVAALADGNRWTVLIAGRQTPPARDLINSWRASNESGPQLWVHDAYVDPVLAGKLFGACDVVWVGYPTHNSMSGVLVQAGLAGKSVVAHEGTLTAALAEQGGFGTVCDVRSPQTVARALSLAVHPDRLAAAQATGPLYFAAHRRASVAQAFIQALSRTIGGEPWAPSASSCASVGAE